MSDQPQPRDDPQPEPAHIVEEPVRQPFPDDDWDGEDDDHDTPAALYPPGSVLWDGVGWPSAEHWWP